MKLLHLKLRGRYKGLKDQTFDFSYCIENVIALIGLNGSGKSQLLELVCEVFAYLERVQRTDFKTRKPLPFKVEIWFQTDDDTYSIKVNSQSRLNCKIHYDDGRFQVISIDDVSLPKYVIGYSSGLNENLQRSFMKNMLQYYEVMRIRSNYRKRRETEIDEAGLSRLNQYYSRRYSGIYSWLISDNPDYERLEESDNSLVESDTHLPSTIFLDYDCNSLLMASLAILPNNEIDNLLPEIEYRKPQHIEFKYDLRQQSITEDAIKDIRQLLRLIQHFDGVLAGICERTTDEEYDLYELEYLAATITFDLTKHEAKEKLAYTYYGSPLTFFEKFYKIQLLGVRAWQVQDRKNLLDDSFMGNVKKPLKTGLPFSISKLLLANDNGDTIDFNDLSDGEAQLIQTIAASRIFREENTLFIFDEPETHLNPSWRTYYHKYLSRAFEINRQVNPKIQVLLSTHSPFLVSSLKNTNVLHFERLDDGEIIMNEVPNETFGASFEVLIKQYFGLKSLISQTAIDEIKEHIDAGNHREAKQWIEENIGDSMEKAYLLRKLQD